MFTGGAFANASIFALGISRYISASIVIQLFGMAIILSEITKRGWKCRRKINSITRYFDNLICAGKLLVILQTQITSNAGVIPEGLWWFTAVLVLITGTIFVMWLGEGTDRGIGMVFFINDWYYCGLPQSSIPNLR